MKAKHCQADRVVVNTLFAITAQLNVTLQLGPSKVEYQ